MAVLFVFTKKPQKAFIPLRSENRANLTSAITFASLMKSITSQWQSFRPIAIYVWKVLNGFWTFQIRIHTGETPYECQLCGVKFKRVHHLHSHTESKQHAEAVEKAMKKGRSDNLIRCLVSMVARLRNSKV